MTDTGLIDVVYVLGKGSIWRDNELRISLRSLEQNLTGINKVWVVGEKPAWLKNVAHVAADDIYGPNNADGNIIEKVLKACACRSLTDKFLFINDDHVINKPVDAREIPNFHKGDLKTFPQDFFEVNIWRDRLLRTRNILEQKGYPTLHYDAHVPMIFDKNVFPEVIKEFDYQKHTGYTMKSLYGNVVNENPVKYQEQSIFRPYIIKQIEEMVGGRYFFSYNDAGLTTYLKQYLLERFPEPSRFEKTTVREQTVDIFNWFRSARHYDKGVELLIRYSRSKNTRALFSRDYYNFNKLESKLLKLL